MNLEEKSIVIRKFRKELLQVETNFFLIPGCIRRNLLPNAYMCQLDIKKHTN